MKALASSWLHPQICLLSTDENLDMLVGCMSHHLNELIFHNCGINLTLIIHTSSLRLLELLTVIVSM